MHASRAGVDSTARNCLLTYGQATFNLDDGTGILPVEVISRCGRQPSPLPNNGDEVHLTVSIHVLPVAAENQN